MRDPEETPAAGNGNGNGKGNGHRKTVLVIGNFLSQTLGVWGACESLAAQLRGAGWTVITASDRRRRLSRGLDMVRTAWRHRRDYSVAHVEVYSGKAFLWAEAVCWLLRRGGKPYVLTLHGGNLPAFARRWPGRVGRTLRHAAAVTAPSDYLGERLRSYRPDLDVLPNALDLSTYWFRLRREAAPRLLWMRSFHEIYNPSLAVRALELLPSEAGLIMVGRDEADGSLEKTRRLASRPRLAGRVELHGAVPKAEVPSWMQRGDVFVNTASVDNTPVTVLEAMACGLCVVSTNVGGIPYLLEDGENALLVPPDDPPAMAQAVERILRDPALALRLSASGRETAERFDWSAILPRWESLLTAAQEREGA